MQLSVKEVPTQSGLRSLAELGLGEAATLVRLDLPCDFAKRLMELGFLPGSPICAAFSAPGGDPRVFRVEGAEIALRRETALHIQISAAPTAAR